MARTVFGHTLQQVADVGDEYLDSHLACEALAACEVIASLRGNPPTSDSYSESVIAWAKRHPAIPDKAMIKAAVDAIDQISGDDSELVELWEEDDAWTAAVQDLRRRVAG